MSSMRPFEELDERGQVERLERLAKIALGTYGIIDERLAMLMHSVDTTFEVKAGTGGAHAAATGMPARYVLRIYRPEIRENVVRSELRWLEALVRDEKLGVPEPVATKDGALVATASAEGVPGSRYCVLFRWVEGEFRDSTLTPEAVGRAGEFMARLHRYNERFVVPDDFERPRYDIDGLIGNSAVVPPGRFDALISRRDQEMLQEAAAIIREELRDLGEGPEVFGLIHGDLTHDNYLFQGEEVRAIDFADFGWGYYLYDLVTGFLRLSDREDFPVLEKTFLEGYDRVKPLAEKHLEYLEPFKVARVLYLLRRHFRLFDLPKARERAADGYGFPLGRIRRFLKQRAGRPQAPAGDSRDLSEMTTVRFLKHLHRQDVELWVEGERLRFSAPEGALTPALRAELVERKPEVIAFLSQTTAGTSAGIPAIEPLSRSGPPRLSFAQERLWFFDQYQPRSTAYNIAQGVRLEMPIRPAVVEQVFNEIVRRHAVLRTTFATVDGKPVQIIAPALALRLPVVDLRGLPESGREAQARRWVREEASRPFDLSRGPLLRTTLLSLREADHILLFAIHHIVSDGWSSGILIRELLALYRAFSRGEPSPLPELPIQYADFAEWQRQWLRGTVLEAQLSYWSGQLAGAPALLRLPTDRPRPAEANDKANKVTRWFSRALTRKLHALGQRRGVTLFMTLVAAFNTLLYRWTGQDDILIGSPSANRNRAELEGLIGFFANTLVLRSRLSGERTFQEFLDQVRGVTLDAYTHQDLPFEKLVEELEPARSPSHTPLLQVTFALRTSGTTLRSSGLKVKTVSTESDTVAFDLIVIMDEAPEGLFLSLRYRRALFDQTTPERLAVHFQSLLASIVAEAQQRLSALPLLTPAENHQLVVEWCDNPAVPIGGPLANTGLYVLDRTLAPVPVGVKGELLIGGDALARGYLKRPGLTAERFVPNPFASAGRGERLYRTGDLVRYLPAGTIEFLDRLDF